MAIRKTSLQLHVEHKQQQYIASVASTEPEPYYFIPGYYSQHSYSPAAGVQKVDPQSIQQHPSSTSQLTCTSPYPKQQPFSAQPPSNLQFVQQHPPQAILQLPSSSQPQTIQQQPLPTIAVPSTGGSRVGLQTQQHLTQMAVVKTDNETVLSYRKEVTAKEITVDEEGNTEVTQMVIRQYFFSIIQKHLKEIEDENHTPVYKPTFFEKITYNCCQAYTYCGTLKKPSLPKKRLDLSLSLRKAHPIGVSIIMNYLFRKNNCNIGRDILRLVVIIGSFILALFLLIFSAASFGDKGNRELKIAEVCFSAVGVCFSLLDIIIYFRLKRCSLLKKILQCECQKDSDDEQDIECTQACCKDCSCCQGILAVMDVVRIFIIELIFYPNLMINMLQFIVKSNAGQADAFSWLAFITSMLGVVVFVYLKRAFLFCQTVYSMYEIIKDAKLDLKKIYPLILFQVTLVVYLHGLMLLQILMIIMIGSRFHHDHSNDTNTLFTDKSIYMVVCAFLTPLFGILMFFVVSHFWTQKLPIDIIIGALSSFQTKDNFGCKNVMQNLTALAAYLKDEFPEDYKNFQEVTLYTKLIYPFTSPVHVVLCLLYGAMLLGFFVCAMINVPSFGWMVLYLSGICICVIVNFYALAVAFMWLVTIVGFPWVIFALAVWYIFCGCFEYNARHHVI